jgi:hypothetical protein
LRTSEGIEFLTQIYLHTKYGLLWSFVCCNSMLCLTSCTFFWLNQLLYKKDYFVFLLAGRKEIGRNKE